MMKIATSGQSQPQRFGDIAVKSSLIDHQAMGWLYKSDHVAYHLAMAVQEADSEQKHSILDVMTDNQRTLARRAADGSWKQYRNT